MNYVQANKNDITSKTKILPVFKYSNISSKNTTREEVVANKGLVTDNNKVYSAILANQIIKNTPYRINLKKNTDAKKNIFPYLNGIQNDQKVSLRKNIVKLTSLVKKDISLANNENSLEKGKDLYPKQNTIFPSTPLHQHNKSTELSSTCRGNSTKATIVQSPEHKNNKIVYSELAKQLKTSRISLITTTSEIQMEKRNDNSIFITKTTKDTSSTSVNKRQKSISQFNFQSDIEGPEDLHFFYVSTAQNHKKLAFKFDCEVSDTVNEL